MIAVSTLLKSCATPPASWPIACIFCDCAKFSLQRAQFGRVERIDRRAGAVGFVRRGDEERAPSGRLARAADVDRRDIASSTRPPRRPRLRRRRGRASSNAGDRSCAAPASVPFSASGIKPGESGVGARDPAAAIDDGDRHGRRS